MNTIPPSHQRLHGVSVASALAVLAWLAWRSAAASWLCGLIVGIGLAYAFAYYTVPRLQQPMFAAFQAVTAPVRWMMTLIVLAVVYYAVLTPIGIWYRLSGKSIRKTECDAETNWHAIDSSATDTESYFRTF